MTGGTLVGRAGVIHDGRIEGHIVLVTGIALSTGGNVGSRLAQRRRTVMADRAIPGGSRGSGTVVKGRRGPRRSGVVAGIALCGSADMSSRFGLCILENVGTAVAGGTLPSQSSVIHHGWRECSIVLVTGIAGLRTERNVGDGFSPGRDTVMASSTGTGDNALMCETGWFPCRGGMASVALRSRLNVRCRFGKCIGKGVGRVVASCTIPRGYRPARSCMVHGGRRKRGVTGMAGIALCAGRDMVGRLAQGSGAVMASRAVTRSGW